MKPSTKLARLAALSVLAATVFVWAVGTGIALWAVTFPEGMCRWPYTVWALFWPVFRVERVEGERRFCWFRDDETADLHGEWTAQELWQIADMMSPEPDGLAGRGA